MVTRADAPKPLIARFSTAAPGASPPAPWSDQRFRNIERPTEYTLLEDAGTTAVRARSTAGASGLVHPLDVPAGTPLRLTWRWKAEGLIPGANPRTREGDDYTVRVHLTFRFDPDRRSMMERAAAALARTFYGVDLPHAAISYVWDATLPVDTVLPNAYSDRVRMIVVESGTANLGRWMTYERDVAADFRRAFGEPAPILNGVAVMTDTDNTGGSVTAWYGDVVLHTHPAR